MIGRFEYARPKSVEDAVSLLRERGGDAAVYAGGTDLLVEIRNGHRAPALLVDVKGIDELRRLEIGETELRIGAATPLNAVAESRAVRHRLVALADAALSIGTYQIRGRATLAGNVCNASPAADTAPVLLVAGAELIVAGPAGRRSVPVQELFTGVKRTSLSAEDIVVEVRIPAAEGALETAFLKQQRIRGHDLAVVNVAGSVDVDTRRMAVAVGSCAPTPVLLDPVDTRGQSPAEISERLITLAEKATSPISDVRASASYRRAILPVLLRRLCDRLAAEGAVA
ncbi:MAG: xanthine dehydrogenase family protein subunit M [Candidatus Bipolaricaulota bacterium]|nr:MAG: xanthine dehydrogenase family protein subunit M [Candidatus Bipolaricaulota bacterium]